MAPVSLWFIETTTLAHCDAGGREPSTASKPEVAIHDSDFRFAPESGHQPVVITATFWD
jgi:hypothetical protein